MDYYEAINYRGWVKSFRLEQIDNDTEQKIYNYVKCMRGFLESSQNKVEIVRYEEIRKAHLGLFATKAPYYYLLYIHNLETELLNAGLILGQLSFYLMTKDMAVSLLGIEKTKKAIGGNAFYRSETLADGEVFEEDTWVVMFAFGKPEHRIKPSGKKLNKLLLEKNSLAIKEPDSRIKEILSSGSFAPSKMLIRPFYYVINGSHVYLYAKHEAMMTSSQRVCVFLDAGIMLAYFGVKAEELWMTMIVKRTNKRIEKKLKKYSYIASISFEDQ